MDHLIIKVNLWFFLGCGERNDESRIVGGGVTGVSEYPWMARLSYFNRFYCGKVNDPSSPNLYFFIFP